nr:YbbR-like domain-containing protein [Cytophagales bacterium]
MSKIRKYFDKLKPDRYSNLKVVALCVLTATTFWILNALNKDNYTTVVNQSIVFLYDQEEYMAVGELPGFINIQINGNGWDLLRKYFRIQATPFVIKLDDPASKGYVLTRDIERELADNLSPTQLVSIIQDTVKFTIDPIVSRKIKIELDTTENILSNNFRFASPITIDPETVTVTGAISVLQKLDGKLLVDMGEDNVNKNFSKLLPLVLPKEYRDYLELEEQAVLVSFDVVEFLEGKIDLPLTKRYFPSEVSIDESINSVSLEYLLDERSLEEFQKLELSAIVNYNNRNEEDSTVNIALSKKPSYLEIVAFDPPTFKLIYE